MEECMRFVALLISALFVHEAHAEKVGDWSYQTQRGFFAATANDSGNVFGQWCDVRDGNCMYLIAIPMRCEEGETYPVLANSDSSANAVEIVCRGPLEGRNADGRALYRFVFTNFASIDHQVRQSQRIGFAFPTQGDAFHVSRFSLSGALQAISAMRSAAERAVSSGPARQGTRDQRL
jgi:hypothetical protein